MKRLIILITFVLISNWSVEALSFVLAIKGVNHDAVKVYPTYAKCVVAKAKAIKKDGKNWDCHPVDYN